MSELKEREYMEVTVKRCKVGPITARYQNGTFREIDPRNASDEPTRYAICGLDNSHNRDYKVAYASDPVVIFVASAGFTHNELRKTLQEHNLWKDEYRPAVAPYGTDKWKSMFVSSPRSASQIDLLKGLMERGTDRDMDYRESESAATGFIPKPA